jgi:glycosyltransferase involved in cell wall biosynthesis
VKPKVLIIVENQSVPPDFRVLKEARSLRDNGYEVTVLCPRRKNWSRGLEIFEGIRIYRHPTPSEGHTTVGYLWEYGCALFWESLYTWWIYLRHGFHVIQGCNPPDNLFLVALPFKVFGIKYIFDHHDASPELYLSKSGRKTFLYEILLALEKGTYRFSDAVMVTNKSYRELALTRGGVAAENVFIVRNGPDPKTFHAVTPNPALKDGKRYLVGYVGTMNSQDGLDILVEVAQYLKELGRRDIRFVCVGGGPELPTLRKMVRERSLADMVHFTGFIPDREMLEVLSTADVCVNPDKPCQMNDISTMIKVLEYMALGKPIVQFDSKEGRFSAEGASLYADKNNQVPDFANKILWLLEHPDERKKMGEAGRNRIESELAWKHSVGNLLAAYEKVLSRPARTVGSNQPRLNERADLTGSEAMQTNATVTPTTRENVGSTRSSAPYVLITPARNEAAFIEKTIESVIHQTVLPLKWIIVNDGSTDRTAEIVRSYLADYDWIEMVQLPQRRDRSFAGKVEAFNAGMARVRNLPYELIGNLDGDISFGVDHFEFLANKFLQDPDLGVAGTIFKEDGGYSSDKDSFEGHRHVAGQCQVFRRKCWEEIGGYVPHRAGGIDWMAVITARMMGWKTESFRERWFFHYRRLGTADRGVVASSFAYGKKDYYLGGHPIWEACRVAYRLTKPPYVIGGLALGAGYFWAWIKRSPRPVSSNLMAFHRREQLATLRAILSSLMKLRRVDNFNVHPRTCGTRRTVQGI